jgi:hypothetical protein
MGDLTFPAIVVRGQYVGGADNLSAMLLDHQHQQQASTSNAINSNAFDRLLQQPRPVDGDRGTMERIAWYPPHAAKEAKPNLFLVPKMGSAEEGVWYPRDWPWYSFQWCIFG